MKRIRWSRVVIVGVLTLGALGMILPYYWMVLSSIKPPEELYTYPPRFVVFHPTLKAYIELFTLLPMARALLNSVFVASAVTVSNLLFCSLAGYAFAKLRFPGRDGIFLVLLFSLMIPWQVNLIPGFVIIKQLGWLNSFWALIIPKLALPFGIFLCRQYIMSIPDALIEAARIDGCTELGIYRRVILPLIVPALATLAIFTFLAQWNDFVWPLIVIQSRDMRTVPLIIQVLNGQFGANFAMIMAGALVVTLPMLLIFLVFQRQFIRGVFLTTVRE
ncbi:MAG: sugar ABC transporter permease [Candidatus Omnitrophica bacterium CG11_big_fil_rev_8_21_14_0_20_63_9]|nr:MAG: sugar ABC transporter permease [Candidatus Omnitrophica bacterium CG11_big_fil_rev_8_21_14_0_20_63_9]